MDPTYDFSGRVAFVTGAGSGMGPAAARAFAASGAAVALADADEAAVRRAARDLSRRRPSRRRRLHRPVARVRPVGAGCRMRHRWSGRPTTDEFRPVVRSAPSYTLRRENTMRRIIVCTFLTLDGVMQAPGGPDEDGEGGFEHGGWQKPTDDEEVGAAVAGWYEQCDSMLLGRRTYEIFASYWPAADPGNPFTPRMNGMRKYVASRTLTSVEWQNSTLLEGDAADAVRALKASDGGDVFVVGSGDLAQTLMRHHLVDEYRLTIHPVIIGTGKRLFAGGAVPTALEPVSVSTTKGGTVIGVYRTNGEPEYDSY